MNPFGMPGKIGPAVFAFLRPKASAQRHHHPDVPFQPEKTPEPELEGSPIRNGASPVASALGALPGATPAELCEHTMRVFYQPSK